MNIGEKIKKLRTAKLMTQSELVGGEITRNMLSRIENGAANPSLETVYYIANRLKVSPSYLLADENDEKIFQKHNEIVGIKKAFMNEDHKICRDMCINTDIDSDDEVNLIFAECSLALGIEKFDNGMLRSASAYFDEAIEVSSKTIYNTEHIRAIAATYFRYMRRVSATLSSDVIDEYETEIFAAMSDEFSRYSVSFDALEDGNLEMANHFAAALEEDQPYMLHISAKIDMREGRFEEAYQKLYLILINPYKIQEPLMYFVFCDLEICCKEIKDFKGAYEYSHDKIEVLQKMLSDN